MMDYSFAGMFCQEHIEHTIKECFTTYRGACLDTSVFEHKYVLADPYGEDAKLIFALQDQGGEQAGDEICMTIRCCWLGI
jgi:histidyl-tRNA synthetase